MLEVSGDGLDEGCYDGWVGVDSALGVQVARLVSVHGGGGEGVESEWEFREFQRYQNTNKKARELLIRYFTIL